VKKISQAVYVELLTVAAVARQQDSMIKAMGPGFVLVSDADDEGEWKVVGWCCERGSYPGADPSGWCPGVYAISESQAVFVSNGGNPFRGAWSWTPVEVER